MTHQLGKGISVCIGKGNKFISLGVDPIIENGAYLRGIPGYSLLENRGKIFEFTCTHYSALSPTISLQLDPGLQSLDSCAPERVWPGDVGSVPRVVCEQDCTYKSQRSMKDGHVYKQIVHTGISSSNGNRRSSSSCTIIVRKTKQQQHRHKITDVPIRESCLTSRCGSDIANRLLLKRLDEEYITSGIFRSL